MKFKKSISVLLASILVAVQLPLVALADQQPVVLTTPTTQSSGDSTTQTQPTTTPDPAATSTPAPASSSTPAPAPSTTTPAPASATGPTTPPGPDANKYTLNPTTGLWESPQYTWNPTTKQTTPKADPGYYYNPSTGMWDTTSYQYHPETGTYQPVTVSAPTAPVAASATGTGSTTGGVSPDMMAALAQIFGGNLSNANTGPNSTNSIVDNSKNTGFFDMFSKAVVDNNLNSSATTGNANVTGNTIGGNATSGSAQVVANLLNLLNSAWSWSSGGLSTFVQNFFGNQNGNVLLNPGTATGGGGQLGSTGDVTGSNSGTGPNSTNTINAGNNNALDVNSQSSGTINNNVNLLAQSGNAGVTGNTTGGNATSGDATADVNIMNLINSAIGAGQSFFGVVNVFGNLTGNVLFPQGFLDGVAATSNGASATPASASNSDTGPNSTNQIGADAANTATLNNKNSDTINNNLNSAAKSGTANVADNTSAGSATTGSATTNTDAFNFAGNLASNNAVLVLVNVLGHWVGGILNLPQTGTTQAALLTGGQTALSNSDTGPNSSNSVNASSTNTANVNSSSANTINNNVTAGAQSGNATVADNTKGGNATSGNASVASNVANFVGSTLNIKNWFGVLMINVFGDWNGSVTTATPDTQLVTVHSSTTTSATPASSNHLASASTTGSSGQSASSTQVTTSAQSKTNTPDTTKVLSAHAAPATSQSRQLTIWVSIAATLMLLAGMMVSIDRKLGRAS